MFVPDEEAARQLEAWLLATAPDLAAGVFPGWEPRAQASALTLPDARGWFLARAPWAVGRPVAARTGGTLAGIAYLAPAEAADLGLEAAAAPAPPAAGTPPAPTLVLRGVPVVVSLPGQTPAATAEAAFAALFRAWWDGYPGRRAPDLPLLPEAPEATALAAVEGRLLGRALHEPSGEAGLLRLATQIALVRRERRADFEPEREEGEQALEAAAGLARYAGACCAGRLGGGAPALPPPDLTAALADAADLPVPARCGLSGWALALLLDVLERTEGIPEGAGANRRPWVPSRSFAAGWKAALSSGAPFDAVLEMYVQFDGGSRDDSALAAALAAHGHAAVLEGARRTAAEAAAARQALMDGILKGEGTLLAIEVRQLGPARVQAPTPAQAVNAGLAVYPDGASFAFDSGPRLAFQGLPVAEDRRSGLLQARVRGRLHLQGDGTPLQGERPAAFSGGLDLAVPGIRVRALGGTIEPIEGGYLLRLVR